MWIGGAGIGAVLVAMWWLSGRYGHVPEHPVTLEDTFLATNSHRMEALSMASSVGYALDWLLYFSDASKVLTIGIVSLVGVVVGSAAVALVTRSFRWESVNNIEDMSNHLIGAILMGFGGVTALGCTIGQGLSGISTLSLGSALALAGIVAGALAAFRYQSWRLDRVGRGRRQVPKGTCACRGPEGDTGLRAESAGRPLKHTRQAHHVVFGHLARYGLQQAALAVQHTGHRDHATRGESFAQRAVVQGDRELVAIASHVAANGIGIAVKRHAEHARCLPLQGERLAVPS